MKRITKEQLKKVKELDILTYFKNYEPNELVKRGRTDYSLRSHTSLHISKGLWCYWTEGIGGRSALDYLIKVEKKDFLEAAIYLYELIENKPPTVIKQDVKHRKPIELNLPLKNEECTVLKNYLIEQRCLDEEIVEYCLENKLIYECKTDHSVVFLGYDSHKLVRYATKRATTGTFKGDVEGSDKRYSFSIQNPNSHTLRVFESAIDLLSYMTLQKQANRPYLQEHYLSISGASLIGKSIEDTSLPIALENYLFDYEIDTIYLHLDNDRAGIETSQKIAYWLKDNCEIHYEPPKYLKDYNEVLIRKCLKLSKKREERML